MVEAIGNKESEWDSGPRQGWATETSERDAPLLTICPLAGAGQAINVLVYPSIENKRGRRQRPLPSNGKSGMLRLTLVLSMTRSIRINNPAKADKRAQARSSHLK